MSVTMLNHGLSNYVLQLKSYKSLRPEITLETFERENAQGEKSAHYWPRVTVYVHNLPHSYLLDAGLLILWICAFIENSKSWFKLLEEGAYLQKGERRIQVK